MPLFRFHLRTPDGLEYDTEGLDLSDLEAAYLNACATVPALAAEFLKAGRDPLLCAFVITDAEDQPLIEVPVRERLRDKLLARSPRKGAPWRTTEVERAQRLIDEVRHEHAQLHHNLSRMRALLAGAPPPEEAA